MQPEWSSDGEQFMQEYVVKKEDIFKSKYNT